MGQRLDELLSAVARDLAAALPDGLRQADLRFIIESRGLRLRGCFIDHDDTAVDAKLHADALRSVMRCHQSLERAGFGRWRELAFRLATADDQPYEVEIEWESDDGSYSSRSIITASLAPTTGRSGRHDAEVRPPDSPVNPKGTDPVDASAADRTPQDVVAADVSALGGVAPGVAAQGRVPRATPSSTPVAEPDERPRAEPATRRLLESAVDASAPGNDPALDAVVALTRLRDAGGPPPTRAEHALMTVAMGTDTVPECLGEAAEAWALLRDRCLSVGTQAVALAFPQPRDRTVVRVFVLLGCAEGIQVADMTTRRVALMSEIDASGLGSVYAVMFGPNGTWPLEQPPIRPADPTTGVRVLAEYANALRRHRLRARLVADGAVPIEGTAIRLVPDRGGLRVAGGDVAPAKAAALAVDLARDVLAELTRPGDTEAKLVRITPRGRLFAEPASTMRDAMLAPVA